MARRHRSDCGRSRQRKRALEWRRRLAKAVVSRGVAAKALRDGALFDLAFANILAKPLRLLAPSLARVIADDGEAILSGLLYADVPGVLSAWRAQGFYLRDRIDLEGWASLRLTR